MNGLFISFEGPEGAGKSTQAKRLAESLRQDGIEVLLTREPGGTALGDGVRSLLLDADVEINPVSEFLLFSASRAQLVRDVLRPALERGAVVIVDRFSDSSFAYQGFGRGLNLEWLQEVTWEATGGLRPHITVLLDLAPSKGLERAANKGAPDRLERADLAFHERVRAGFKELALGEPERWLMLDAMREPDELAQMVYEAVRATLRHLFP